MFSRVYAAGVCCAGLLLASPILAQGSEADVAFDKGVEAMLDGRYDEGCPSIAKADELDPTAGTVFTLAECYAKWGKPRPALKHYEEFLRRYAALDEEKRKKQEQRREVTLEQIAAIKASVARLELVGTENLPEDASVTLDGETVSRDELTSTMILDEGEHVLRVEAEGYEPFERRLTVDKGAIESVEVELESEGVFDSDWTIFHTLAVTSAGIGVANLIIGAVAGGVMLSEKSVLEDNCEGSACNARGKDAADSAQLAGNLSSAGWIIGLVGIGAGVTLWLLAPDGDEEEARWHFTPALSPEAGMLIVEGAF